MDLHVKDWTPIFRKASPQAVSAYVNRQIGNHHIESRGASSGATLYHRKLGPLGLAQLTYGTRVVVSAPEGLDDTYHLQVVVDGCCKIHHASGGQTLLTPGTATLINPMDSVSMEYSPDCVKLIIHLPSRLVDRCHHDQFGYVPAGGVHFCSTVLLMDSETPFAKMIELLLLEANDTRPEDCAVNTSMGILLGAKLMEVFARDSTHGASDSEFFHRIDAFLDEAAWPAVTPNDVARFANMSVRTLYEQFRKAQRTAPHAYIKERRLHQAHRHLRSRTNARNVTEVALRYGFSHLGRFSSDYKAIFGELPSETLRGRRT